MNSRKFILVTGGASCGKSGFAEKMASSIHEDVTYVATAAVLDDEMERKVERHRLMRPKHWKTVEETINLDKVLLEYGNKSEVVLIDCLTLWISNQYFNSNEYSTEVSWSEREDHILDNVKKLVEIAAKVPATTIIVSNEVSMGLVPENPLGRAFRNSAGKANQLAAEFADEVYLIVAGIPLGIKA
ncbi:MAG: bifunctional adenosylcobinamide kinase/adenosylcobinamide-phosphate guanylyltransferase [Firmicutes bacterium]|nr:bifunctional adenosylcobinamide kinase/adenosylcobinamide-phosphate guanylyltransferase [Bacillota bacterium]